MRFVRTCARGVSVLSLVVALSVPAYAVERDRGDKEGFRFSKNPIVKVITSLIQKVCGDGILVPWPSPNP